MGGLLLVVMDLTGSAIVFHQKSDRALKFQRVQVAPQGERISIDTFWKSAQACFPNSRLELIQMSQSATETYKLRF